MEQAEKLEFLDRQFNSGEPAPSLYSVNQEKRKNEEQLERIGRYTLNAKVVNVLGQESEPICDYLRCHHAFSLHGLRSSKCRCKQPQNAAIGA